MSYHLNSTWAPTIWMHLPFDIILFVWIFLYHNIIGSVVGSYIFDTKFLIQMKKLIYQALNIVVFSEKNYILSNFNFVTDQAELNRLSLHK